MIEFTDTIPADPAFLPRTDTVGSNANGLKVQRRLSKPRDGDSEPIRNLNLLS
jgi:hypothetical protein